MQTLNKLSCSLCYKVRRLEKRTLPPAVTIVSYVYHLWLWCKAYHYCFVGLWPLWFDASLFWKWFLAAGRPQVGSSLIKLKVENIHRVNVSFHQTRNMSQMTFVKRYFWARVKYSRTNAKNTLSVKFAELRLEFSQKYSSEFVFE